MKLNRTTYLQIILVILFIIMLFLSPVIPSVIPNFTFLYIVIMFSILILFFAVFMIGFFVSIIREMKKAEEKRKKLGLPDIGEIVPGYRKKLVLVLIISFVVLFGSRYLLFYMLETLVENRIRELLTIIIPPILWLSIIFAYVIPVYYKYKKMTKQK